MNGAEAILSTLADSGVRVCFANPGTSEMQMVSAFDRERRVRPVLCLFEGVATGAADGYGRMAGTPAAALLHLGAGLANGGANLHNARRAATPLVSLIGEHATYHRAYDAPLTSDIEALARPFSQWVKLAESADAAAALAAEAVQASLAPPGGVASLIIPADAAWSPAEGKRPVLPRPARASPDWSRVDAAARALKAADKPVILLGQSACTERGLDAAGRLSAVGYRVLMDTFVARLPRGAGRFHPDRMLYFGEMALADLQGVDLVLLAGAKLPVAFFAYPAMPSVLVPEGCRTMELAGPAEDAPEALARLAEAAGAPLLGLVSKLDRPGEPTGELNAYTIGDSLCRWMPEGAIVSDDAVTAGLPIFMQTRGARPHDWLALTGGAIGQGIPLAIGAAMAAPDRKVLSLNGDGAAAYTLQGLWTVAREGLDITTVVFANHRYRILDIELKRTRSGDPGARAKSLLSLEDPRMDWLSLARGFGVPAVRADTPEAFDVALRRAMAEPGPAFIEAAMA
jgi:acetolactate synthase-1/2/3 large subunit